MGISLNGDGSATSTDTGLTSSPSGSSTTDQCKDDNKGSSPTDAEKFQKELNKSSDGSGSGQVKGQAGTRCSVSDLYSGTPKTTSSEEEEKKEEADQEDKHNAVDRNKQTVQNHWDGHATSHNIPKQEDLDNLGRVERVNMNGWGNHWTKDNPYPDCDRALGNLNKEARCKIASDIRRVTGSNLHEFAGN
jgi:hypothetical protein